MFYEKVYLTFTQNSCNGKGRRSGKVISGWVPLKSSRGSIFAVLAQTGKEISLSADAQWISIFSQTTRKL